MLSVKWAWCSGSTISDLNWISMRGGKLQTQTQLRHRTGASSAHLKINIYPNKKGMNCCVQIIANQFKDTKTITGNFFKFNHNFQNQKFSYLTLKKIEG